jgi:hypothetical protein
MTKEEFEEKIRQDCGYCGVALEVTQARSLADEDGVSNGWFSDDPPKLAYAKGHDHWFPVALHEYNHMCQWSEGSLQWHNKLQREADLYLWDWLADTIMLGPGLQKKYCMVTLQLELDCERRAQKMITDLNLPLDTERYAQTANAYIMFYHLVLKHRKWYEIGKEPYHIEEIVSAMPKDLHTLNYEEISDEMVTLFDTHMPYLSRRRSS